MLKIGRRKVTYCIGEWVEVSLFCENSCSQVRFWLGRLDSNQRMTVSKTVALPLGDAPESNLHLIAINL